MTENRKIKKVFKSKPALEGAGVHLRRVFGNSGVPLFDPFLILNDSATPIPISISRSFPGTRIASLR